jgi:hypothetical protein
LPDGLFAEEVAAEEVGRGGGLVPLRGQDLGGAGVDVREEERDTRGEHSGREGQAEDQHLVLGEDDREIQKTDLVFWIGDW